ncbi:hypothetical protein [Cronobacter sakazakii]|uniref:hypothetical protein n=1 Tax=Cronobacter sakazakii TaxID=28141 RepID=UPI003CE6A5F4
MDRLNQQDLRTLYFAEQSIQQSWQMNREKLPHVTQRSLKICRLTVPTGFAGERFGAYMGHKRCMNYDEQQRLAKAEHLRTCYVMRSWTNFNVYKK